MIVLVKRELVSMDGNTAAAHVSYAYTEVAAIYPITPSSPMADNVDIWAAQGRKNVFGDRVRVVEMQAESGAAGAVHGSLNAGALTTTYTASQGLLLMIPNMYKMAGELLPAVFHVSARSLAAHALSIFGDHQDVYACRQTGFAMLCESSVQEIMDLSPVAHLSAIEGRVPFLNFFDGFRTSHEIQKVAVWDYADLESMLDRDAVAAFRARALNPEHPVMRGSHENGDIYFQNREAANRYYEALPEIVEANMAKINAKLGTDYQLFNYYGAPDAERVIVAMGSICDVCEEVIDYLNARGEKVGLVNVHLYRPFRADRLLAAIPETVKSVAVLDRTKEPGAQGEPLYMDVVTAFAAAGRSAKIIGGRYGLSSKDTPPAGIFAVYEELKKDQPKPQFTIGIVDDVTKLSLLEMSKEECPSTAAPGTIECKFWGLGGDGTVGANKNSTKIIGDHTDKYIQSYFQYDSKKTGGVTISHLRFGDKPIKSPYYINKADFVACHTPGYITKGFPIVQDVKPGGTFLINCQWDFNELDEHLDAASKRYMARNNIQLYTINAIDLARKVGMGRHTNTVLQSAFFTLANILPAEDAIRYMKEAAKKSYLKKGQDVVDANYAAIDAGATAFVKHEIPAAWATAEDKVESISYEGFEKTVKMVKNVMEVVNRMDGDSLPVSAFTDHADGTFELGASAYEKRGVSNTVPVWDPSTCAQCNQCSFVCPHATIRPFALTAEEAAAAPEGTVMVDHKLSKGKYKFALAISPMDCMGCGVCVSICPTHSLQMVSQEEQLDKQAAFNYLTGHVTVKAELSGPDSVVKSQYLKPYLEFSGSCAGCAETSYARLVTQLFGDRMIISNATGCSSIWGGPASISPYVKNAEGKGTAWANSLFEDNAEHGYGIYLGQKTIRNRLREQLEALAAQGIAAPETEAWLRSFDDTNANAQDTEALISALRQSDSAEAKAVLANQDYLAKKSVWIFGGDGWAFDIGFGGLDHVLASGEDVNVFVFNTEVYSNTGGQASKASNIGQVAQFAAAGKEVKSKSLAEIAMTYGYVYVAQVAMGANMSQTLKAIREAEAWHGPSLIIGYSPCEMHSIKGGMANCQLEMKKAVDCGYWNLFRFDPSSDKPFTLDSREPKDGYQDFLRNEARYARLTTEFPERAETLFEKNEANAKERWQHLLKLKALYE